MPRDRFFVAGVHRVGESVALASDDAHKIVAVLRRRSGERVQVVDSGGTAFEAVLAIDGKAVHALLAAPLVRPDVESSARIVLAQAIPKGQRMDFIVEKATELGVATIVPLRSDRVIGERTGDHKHERWQRIAKAAAQQSGRARIPVVEPVADWAALRATFRMYDRVYVAWELAAAQPLRERFEAEARTSSAILLVVGPEGGFSSTEVEQARLAGGVPVSLGARIVRTETAALVLLAALLYARGEV